MRAAGPPTGAAAQPIATSYLVSGYMFRALHKCINDVHGKLRREAFN